MPTHHPNLTACVLERPTPADAGAVAALLAAWRRFGGRLNPGLLREYKGDYPAWLQLLAQRERAAQPDGAPPQTLYLMKDPGGAVVGAVAIRAYLNHTNALDGGHVAYGVAPACRGRGYGAMALRLALAKLRQQGVNRALITCDADNLPSQRVIFACGGRIENQALDEDGVLVNRYWAPCR